MKSYDVLVLTLLGFVFALVCTLVYVRRPSRWIEVFRGGEISVCVAFAVDAARQFATIVVSDSTYPGVFWGTLNLTLFAVEILFLGGRISQHIRHQMINRQSAWAGIEALRALGEDVSELEKHMKGKK